MALTLDYAEVSQLGLRLKAAQRLAPERIETWLHETVGPLLVKYMKEEAPEASGALKNSIRQVNTPGEVAVGTQGIEYVKFVIEGTRPHEIRPRNSSTLAFKVGGQMVFARVVHHPGTAPNDFMVRAAKRAMRESMSKLNGLSFAQEKNVQRSGS